VSVSSFCGVLWSNFEVIGPPIASVNPGIFVERTTTGRGGANVLEWRDFSNFHLMQLCLGHTDTRFMDGLNKWLNRLHYSVDKGKVSFILRAKSLEVHRRSEAIGAAFCHTGLNEER